LKNKHSYTQPNFIEEIAVDGSQENDFPGIRKE